VSTGQVRLWDAATGAIVGTLAEEHSALAWASDRPVLATGTKDRVVCVWNRFGARQAVLGRHDEEVLALAWSPDGVLLASSSHDKTVRLWRPYARGQPIVLSGHGNSVVSLAWSPDGRLLATGSTDQTVRLWHRGATGSPMVLEGHSTDVRRLAWSPDGTVLASGSGDGAVHLWRLDTLGRPVVLKGHGDWITGLVWSLDGRMLASSSREGTVRLWRSNRRRAPTYKPLELLDGPRGEVCLAWAPDGTLLASAGHDGVVRLWRTHGDEQPVVLEGHTAEVSSLAWSPDGAMLVSGAYDGAARLWAAERADARRTPMRHTAPVTAVALSPDGAVFASASEDRTVRLWDTASGRCHEAKEVPQVPRRLAWSADGKRLAETGSTWPSASSSDDTEYPVRVWTRDGEACTTMRGHCGEVYAVSWTRAGETLAIGGVDRSIALFDLSFQSPERLGLMLRPRHRGWVVSLAWSPAGEQLASGDNEGGLRLWDAGAAFQGRFPLLAAMHAHDGWVPNLAWSPDGGLLASAGLEDRLLRIWQVHGDELVMQAELPHALDNKNAPTGSPITITFEPGKGRTAEGYVPITSSDPLGRGGPRMAWSPDGSILAVGSWQSMIRLWRRGGAAGPVILEGHAGQIGALAWSPDGRLLASGGSDGVVRLWDVEHGKVQATALCLGYVMALKFSTDGRTLRAVDDGSATGNRPLPYVFELAGLRGGQAITATSTATPHRQVRSSTTPLDEALRQAGLQPLMLPGGGFLLPPPPRRPDEAAVQARTADDSETVFLTALPKPSVSKEEAVLRNLLRVSFEADYIKAILPESGDLRLACVLPSELVTAEVAAGVVSGLFELGGCAAGKLANAGVWRRRLRACRKAQDSRIKLDPAINGEAVRSLAEQARLKVTKRRDGSLVIRSWLPGADLDLLVRSTRRAVSLILSLDRLFAPYPPADPGGVSLRRLLRLSSQASVAKVGLDSGGGFALLYQVPAVLPLLLERVQEQFERMLAYIAEEALVSSTWGA
jgi:WD40 repeat protein